jgi:hypothetical protein
LLPQRHRDTEHSVNYTTPQRHSAVRQLHDATETQRHRELFEYRDATKARQAPMAVVAAAETAIVLMSPQRTNSVRCAVICHFAVILA